MSTNNNRQLLVDAIFDFATKEPAMIKTLATLHVAQMSDEKVDRSLAAEKIFKSLT